jgi:hypothetical protein
VSSAFGSINQSLALVLVDAVICWSAAAAQTALMHIAVAGACTIVLLLCTLPVHIARR